MHDHALVGEPGRSSIACAAVRRPNKTSPWGTRDGWITSQDLPVAFVLLEVCIVAAWPGQSEGVAGHLRLQVASSKTGVQAKAAEVHVMQRDKNGGGKSMY